MFKFIALICFLVGTALAQDGKILEVRGSSDAYILRSGQKILASVDFPIEVGDEVHSMNSVVLLHVFPSTQIVIAKNSEIKLDKNIIDDVDGKEKSQSIIGFMKGLIRLKLTKDAGEEIEQRVEAKDVAFAVRGTDYEIAMLGDEFDLDVHEGAVEVSSPLVMTFVPEVVKAGKGLRFNRAKRSFGTKKLGSRFKNGPGFIKKEELRKKWKEARQIRKDKKLQKQGLKKRREEALREKREIRRKSKRKNR